MFRHAATCSPNRWFRVCQGEMLRAWAVLSRFVRSRLQMNSTCAGSHGAHHSSTCQHVSIMEPPGPAVNGGIAAESQLVSPQTQRFQGQGPAIVLLKGCFSTGAKSGRDQKCLSRWRGAIERGSRNGFQWDGAAACFGIVSCMCQPFHRSA